jgi:hypothetical protein
VVRVKKKFKDEVAKIIAKYEQRAPYLNALLIWAHNSTSKSAGYGFEDNIPFIEKNISLMFQEENPLIVANTTYSEIRKLGDIYKQIHTDESIDPFYTIYDEIRMQIYTNYSTRICSHIQHAIDQSNDFRILELANALKIYLTRKDLLDYKPVDFAEEMDYIFDNTITDSNLAPIFKLRIQDTLPNLDFLISVGLLYEMYYESSTGKTKGPEYLIPLHVPEALSDYTIPLDRAIRKKSEPVSSSIIPIHEDDVVMLHDQGVQSTIIWKGKVRKAQESLSTIFEDSRGLICIVDNHIDFRTLEMIKEVFLTFDIDLSMNVRILTEVIHYDHDTESAYHNVKSYLPNLEIRWIKNRWENPFHDRYVMTKNAGIQIGSSIKDLGKKKISVISKIDKNDNESLLKIFHNTWNNIGLDFP